MKTRFLSLTLASLFSFSAHASLTDFMAQVLAHPEVIKISKTFEDKNFDDLLKIERTAVYRCPACFDFELTFRRVQVGGYLDEKVKIRTEGSFDEEGKMTLNVKKLRNKDDSI